jgi:hypothetical protein
MRRGRIAVKPGEVAGVFGGGVGGGSVRLKPVLIFSLLLSTLRK